MQTKIRSNTNWKRKYIEKSNELNSIKKVLDFAEKDNMVLAWLQSQKNIKKACPTPLCNGDGSLNGKYNTHNSASNCPHLDKSKLANDLIEELRNHNLLLQNQLNIRNRYI